MEKSVIFKCFTGMLLTLSDRLIDRQLPQKKLIDFSLSVTFYNSVARLVRSFKKQLYN